MSNFTYSRRDIEHAVLGVIEGGLKSVVVFCPPLSSPKGRVKATYIGKRDKRGSTDIKLTIGRLNYAERKYVKLCRKTGTKPRRLWFRSGK